MQEKILIVDDSKFIREMLKGLLISEEYEVFTAENGTQAIDLIKDIRPHLILLDVVMPDMDGFETSAKIREVLAGDTIPIIFLTSRTDVEGKKTGFELGGSDYIIKPFDPEELLIRIKRHLLSYQQRKAGLDKARHETLSQVMVTIAHYINNSLATMQGWRDITTIGDCDQVHRFFKHFDYQTKRIHAVVESLEQMAHSEEIKTADYVWKKDGMLDIAKKLETRMEKDSQELKENGKQDKGQS